MSFFSYYDNIAYQILKTVFEGFPSVFSTISTPKMDEIKRTFPCLPYHPKFPVCFSIEGIEQSNMIDAEVLPKLSTSAFDPSWQSNPPGKFLLLTLLKDGRNRYLLVWHEVDALDPTKPTPIEGHPNHTGKARTLWGHLAGQLGGRM